MTIQKCLANPKGTMQSPPTESHTSSRWAWAVAGALAITTAVALWMPWRAAPELPKPVRFQIAPPLGVIPAGIFSISPDGTKLAYVGFGSDGVSRLWVRTMDTLESHALAGVEMLNVPLFWSPDSRFIAFDTGGKLKKVDLAGGPLQTLCDVPATVVGGSWNRDGVIVFGLNNGAGIQRVSSAGGAPSPVTAMNAARNDRLHLFPVFLPDGRHFLYLVRSAVSENSGVYLGALDTKPDQQEPKRLTVTRFSPDFVPFPDGKGGAILFQSGGTLLAQPFDLHRLETTGEAVPLAEQLGSYIGFGYFAASDNGVLAYRDGASGGTTQLGWFDRQGKGLGVVGTAHNYRGPASLALSPDGTRVAAARTDGNNFDIWLTAFSRASDTRFTFDPASDLNPSGLRTAIALRFHRIVPASSTCTKMRRTARVRTSCCSSRITSSSQRTGPATDASCCITMSIQRPKATCGCCRWTGRPRAKSRAVASRFRFCAPISTSEMQNSLPMATGSRINRTSPEETRSTCGRSRRATTAENGRSRKAAELSLVGAVTTRSCSTSLRTAT